MSHSITCCQPSIPATAAGWVPGLGWPGLDEAAGNLFRAGLFQQHIINHVLLASAYCLAVICYSDLQNIIICWSQACRLMGEWAPGSSEWAWVPDPTSSLSSPLSFISIWVCGWGQCSLTQLCAKGSTGDAALARDVAEPQGCPGAHRELWGLCHIIDHSPLLLGEQRCWMHPSSLLVLQYHISPRTLYFISQWTCLIKAKP